MVKAHIFLFARPPCARARTFPYPGVAFVGHGYDSHTDLLVPLEHDDINLVVWDAPGFSDTRGATLNISNSINLVRLMQETSRAESGGLIVLVMVAAGCIQKGNTGLRNTLAALQSYLAHGDDLVHVRGLPAPMAFDLCWYRCQIKRLLRNAASGDRAEPH